MSLVKSPDREGRMAAIEALGKLHQDEAVDILLSCLKDDDWGLRVAAVKALGGFDGGERVRSALAELSRTDSDPLVRKAAEEFPGNDGESA